LLDKRIAELIAGDAEAAQHADALKDEVAKLAPMRAACIMPQQLDEAAVDRLKEYSRILLLLHKRVPSSTIVFKWHCTITPHGGGLFTSDPAVCRGGLGLELRAVAYQMAVCCAAIAARLSEGDEAVKAAKWFKSAYFLFHHARDGIEVDLQKECSLNRDLTPDVLFALSRVMLAQAANVYQRVMSQATKTRYDREAEPARQHPREQKVCTRALQPHATTPDGRGPLTPLQMFQLAVLANAECVPPPLTCKLVFALD
jgi:hypothetical protein